MFEKAREVMAEGSAKRFIEGITNFETELEYLQIAAKDKNIPEIKKWLKRIEDTSSEIRASSMLYRWTLKE